MRYIKYEYRYSRFGEMRDRIAEKKKAEEARETERKRK